MTSDTSMHVTSVRSVGAIAFLLCAIVCSAQTTADAIPSVEKCRAIAHAVMSKIAEGDDRAALELIRPHIHVDETQFNESRDRTLSERRNVPSRFGRLVGIKLIKEERVSDFLYRLTYVEKREIHLIRWQFTFYRPRSEWQINSYTWDDKVFALFDQAQDE